MTEIAAEGLTPEEGLNPAQTGLGDPAQTGGDAFTQPDALPGDGSGIEGGFTDAFQNNQENAGSGSVGDNTRNQFTEQDSFQEPVGETLDSSGGSGFGPYQDEAQSSNAPVDPSSVDPSTDGIGSTFADPRVAGNDGFGFGTATTGTGIGTGTIGTGIGGDDAGFDSGSGQDGAQSNASAVPFPEAQGQDAPQEGTEESPLAQGPEEDPVPVSAAEPDDAPQPGASAGPYGGQPGGSQAADEGSLDEATFSSGFPAGAGTGGAARWIKAADDSEFLAVAISDGSYARAEQIYPGNYSFLRLSEDGIPEGQGPFVRLDNSQPGRPVYARLPDGERPGLPGGTPQQYQPKWLMSSDNAPPIRTAAEGGNITYNRRIQDDDGYGGYNTEFSFPNSIARVHVHFRHGTIQPTAVRFKSDTNAEGQNIYLSRNGGLSVGAILRSGTLNTFPNHHAFFTSLHTAINQAERTQNQELA